MQQPNKANFKLHPKRVAIIPFENIAGASRVIAVYDEINSSNAIILNEASNINDMISINEDGMQFDLERSGEDIQVLDSAGLGAADEITNSQDATITIGVNGYGAQIQSLFDGLNPLKDIKTDFKFAKSSRTDSVNVFTIAEADPDIQESLADFTGTVILKDGAGIINSGVGESGDGFISAELRINVEVGAVTSTEITTGGQGYTSAPTIDLTQATDFIDSSGTLQTNGSFTSGVVTPTITLGTYEEAAGPDRQDTFFKQKFSIIAEVPAGVEGNSEGNIYVMAPYTTIQSDTNSFNISSNKQSISLSFRGLKLLDNSAIQNLTNFAEPIKNGSGMIYHWNSSGNPVV